MNAVIYARYSSDNQREESIEGQLRECKEYAVKNGMTILNTYIDRALSAKTDNRPEFQHMIKDSAKHLFDVVIVWKLDRFARNRYDSAHYKATLRDRGHCNRFNRHFIGIPVRGLCRILFRRACGKGCARHD